MVSSHFNVMNYNMGLSYIYMGHKGQLAPRCRALGTMIKKLYHGIQKAVHPLRFTNFETPPP